jgi:hypothetical protein
MEDMIHDFFYEHKYCIYDSHVKKVDFLLSVSFSPKTDTSLQTINHIISHFIRKIKPTLHKYQKVELTVNHVLTTRKVVFTQDTIETDSSKEPDFDYMNVSMD